MAPLKSIKHPNDPATTRQREFYELLAKNAGLASPQLPTGTTRQQASDLITGLLSKNPSLRGGSLKQLQAGQGTPWPKVKLQPAKPKPAPVPTKMIRYDWPANPLPPVPIECEPFKHYVVAGADQEIGEFVPREPYWTYLCDAHSDGRFVQLVGEPGCGKSLMGKALAHVLQVPYLPISCDGKLNPRALFGQISIKNGTSFFTEGEFTRLTQVPSVIVLEERNGLDGSVEMTFNRVLNNRQLFIPEADGGRGKVYTLHPNCYIVQDCNPPGAKFTGANKQNVATVDRVQVVQVEQLTETEITSILGQVADAKRLAEFYLEAADILRTNSFRAAVTLRGLRRTSQMLAKGYKEMDAVRMGMLNAVELTGGKDAFVTLESAAKRLFK